MPAPKGNSFAEGNPGGGAPEGNQNAVGNDGGAPVGNTNAAKHHGWSDTLKHYHRLAGDAKELVDRHLAQYVDNYAFMHGMDIETVEADEKVMNDLRRLAAMHDQWFRANKPVFEEGMVIEVEREYEHDDGTVETWTEPKVNPAENASHRITQRQRNLRAELGIGWGEVRSARERQEALAKISEGSQIEDQDAISGTDSDDTDATESAGTSAESPDTDPDPQIESSADARESAEEPVSSVDTDDTETETDTDEDGPANGVRMF